MSNKSTLDLGSVSSGTMRREDLIPSFLWEANRLRLSKGEREQVRKIEKRMKSEDYYESEDSDFDLDELFSILNAHTPDFCYFGSHPGDGADYGVWIDEEFYHSTPDDVLKIDASELRPKVKDCQESHILEVNDHGNMTLWRKSSSRWVECWSVV